MGNENDGNSHTWGLKIESLFERTGALCVENANRGWEIEEITTRGEASCWLCVTINVNPRRSPIKGSPAGRLRLGGGGGWSKMRNYPSNNRISYNPGILGLAKAVAQNAPNEMLSPESVYTPFEQPLQSEGCGAGRGGTRVREEGRTSGGWSALASTQTRSKKYTKCL